MVKISVVIATFNEEKNLDDCLKSVHAFVDEIVIVDGTSSDSTVAIAQKYTDKVILTDNKPMFHINKQMAIDAAVGNWILQLDADERITLQLAKELKEIVSNDSDFGGFWINRKNYFLGKWLEKGGTYPDPVIRFFKKGKGHLPCKSVHEQIEINGKVGNLKNDLIHIADPSFSRYLLRSNRYTSLDAEKLFRQNPGTGFFTILNHLIIKPFNRFFSLYFRHRGFEDGFAGLVWSFYSSLHIFTSYVKYWEAKNAGGNKYNTSSDWT